MLYAGLRGNGFNRIQYRNLWWIGCHVGCARWYAFVWMAFLGMQPHFPTSWSGNPLQHLQYSGDNINIPHKLSNCSRSWHGCSLLFGASQQPKPWIRQFHTPYLSDWSSRVHPPIRVTSFHQAQYDSPGNPPGSGVPFWRMCPSPSCVCHLRSSCPALYLLHHDPDLPLPPPSQN